MPGETKETLKRNAKPKDPDHIAFAGDFNLAAVVIQNHRGEGVDPGTGGENILPQMVELNIYESITKKAITGTVVIADATNLIANLPIQGTERILFKLSTPGAQDDIETSVDASELTGHPFYVYKITNRQLDSAGVLTYTLHFGSREFMRNLRTKVSKAYSGTIDRMVAQIFSDKNGLDSRKIINLEETRKYLEDVGVGPDSNIPFLGVSGLSDGTAGVSRYGSILNAVNDNNILGAVIITAIMPLLMLGVPIAGDGQVMNLREQAMISAGDGVIASVIGTSGLIMLFTFLFWLAWINFLLGFANLIPMIPFDGGHIVKDGVHSSLSFYNEIFNRGIHPIKIESWANKISNNSSFIFLFILIIPVIMSYL